MANSWAERMVATRVILRTGYIAVMMAMKRAGWMALSWVRWRVRWMAGC